MSSVRIECQHCPDVYFDTRQEASDHFFKKHAQVYSLADATRRDLEKELLEECHSATRDVGISGNSVVELVCGLVKEIHELRTNRNARASSSVVSRAAILKPKRKNKRAPPTGCFKCPHKGCNWSTDTRPWLGRHRRFYGH